MRFWDILEGRQGALICLVRRDSRTRRGSWVGCNGQEGAQSFMSFHSSIFCCLSGSRSQGHSLQPSPPALSFPSHLRDIVSPGGPGSPRGLLMVEQCPKHLSGEPTGSFWFRGAALLRKLIYTACIHSLILTALTLSDPRLQIYNITFNNSKKKACKF